MQLVRVNRRNKCQICGKSDWCGIAPDGSLAVCMRVPSDKTTKQGGFIHVLRAEIKKTSHRRKPESQNLRAELEKRGVLQSNDFTPKTSAELNQIYSEFLNELVLANSHIDLLKKRGLSDLAILMHDYKSMPSKLYSDYLAVAFSQNYDLRGVPGFNRHDNGEWRFVDYGHATGYLIPIRNARHEIIALQLRRDDNQKPKYMLISSGNLPEGTSSGTPLHFATVGQTRKCPSAESIIITEGVLKANIISELSGELVVGLVGVGTFGEDLPERLRAIFPELAEVKIAFDMDATTNRAVKTQFERLQKLLKANNLESKILTWYPEYKGMDDFLLSRRESVTKELRLADLPKLKAR